MAENKYDLESLLAEIRKKKAEIEKDDTTVAPVSEKEEADVSVTSILESLDKENREDESVSDIETGADGETHTYETPQDTSPEAVDSDNENTPVQVSEETAPVAEEADPVSPKEEKDRKRRGLRSISRQLTGSFDAIPGDFTGDFFIGHPVEKEDTENIVEIDFSRPGAEEHPVFAEKTASFNVIPPIDDEDIQEHEQPEEEITEKGELRIDAEDKLSVTQGILNIKDSLDDNFRELFGDTVIVEHGDRKDRGSRRRERRRSRLDELESLEMSEPGEEMEEEPDTIFEILNKRSNQAVVKTIVTGLGALILGVFTYFCVIKGSGFGRTPTLVTAAIMAVCVAFNWKEVFLGTLDLFRFRASLSSLAGFSALLSLLEPLAYLAVSAEPDKGYTACVSALTLLICDIGDMLKATRDLQSFRTVSENPQKYASSVLKDQNFTQVLTNDFSTPFTGVLMSRRTNYTDRFLDYCDSDNIDFNRPRKASSFIGIGIILVGVISMVINRLTLPEALKTASLAAALSAPFMSSLMMELPIHRLQRRLNRLGAVIPGYGAAEDVASANCVVIEGREIFPREKVLLHGIKTFEKERIDQAILYAASVLIHSCDTMSHMFLKVIQGKTDMLFETDSVVYEEGLGFSFWVDQNRILVGRRELLESHEIEVPSRDYENRYTKASTRDAIYLAVAGKLYAMFVIGYSPDEEMTELLHGLERNNINIIVRTRDFIVSPEKISKMYDIPQSMISMVRDSSMQELAKKTEYTRHCTSSLTHVGSVGAFLGGMIGSNNLITNAGISAVIGFAGMIVGILLSAVLALMGGLDTVKLTSVLLFQIVWSVIHLAVIYLRRV